MSQGQQQDVLAPAETAPPLQVRCVHHLRGGQGGAGAEPQVSQADD